MGCTELKAFSRNSRAGLAIAGLSAVLLSATGCAVFDDVAHGQAQGSFATAQLLEQDRGEALAWLPEDAQQIVHVASTRTEGTESLVFTSHQEITGCETVGRKSTPTMNVPGGLDVYAIERVLLCGEWAIAEDDGDFYAWTPAAESGSR